MYKIGQKVKVRKTIANGWLKIKAINKVKWMDEEMEELTVIDDIGREFQVFSDFVVN